MGVGASVEGGDVGPGAGQGWWRVGGGGVWRQGAIGGVLVGEADVVDEGKGGCVGEGGVEVEEEVDARE